MSFTTVDDNNSSIYLQQSLASLLSGLSSNKTSYSYIKTNRHGYYCHSGVWLIAWLIDQLIDKQVVAEETQLIRMMIRMAITQMEEFMILKMMENRGGLLIVWLIIGLIDWPIHRVSTSTDITSVSRQYERQMMKQRRKRRRMRVQSRVSSLDFLTFQNYHISRHHL